mmetsp:Transcript_26301/g.59737  ORF Transcript_26301/g.59737 Transcript_26301/m.59737 type:complete len:133 (-) Transcript_26301:217-615(-)
MEGAMRRKSQQYIRSSLSLLLAVLHPCSRSCSSSYCFSSWSWSSSFQTDPSVNLTAFFLREDSSSSPPGGDRLFDGMAFEYQTSHVILSMQKSRAAGCGSGEQRNSPLLREGTLIQERRQGSCKTFVVPDRT